MTPGEVYYEFDEQGRRVWPLAPAQPPSSVTEYYFDEQGRRIWPYGIPLSPRETRPKRPPKDPNPLWEGPFAPAPNVFRDAAPREVFSDGQVTRRVGSGQASVAKPVNTSRTTQTFTDDPHLGLPIPVRQSWQIDGYLKFSASVVGGMKIQFVVPPGAVLQVTVSEDGVLPVSVAAATAVVLTGAGATLRGARISGLLHTDAGAAADAPGYVFLQWARNAADGTTTLYQGSWLSGRRMV